MNAHSLSIRKSRPNLVLTLVILLTSIILGVTSRTAWSSAKGEGGAGSNDQGPASLPASNVEDIKKEFNDDDLKMKGGRPRGKWGFATVFDRGQLESSSIPVAISGIQSLSGGEKYSGVTKIKRIELRNRSPKIVNSVQLRWTLAPLDEPEKVLSEGATQFANIWVEANSSKVVEIPTLYPALLLNSLAKAAYSTGDSS